MRLQRRLGVANGGIPGNDILEDLGRVTFDSGHVAEFIFGYVEFLGYCGAGWSLDFSDSLQVVSSCKLFASGGPRHRSCLPPRPFPPLDSRAGFHNCHAHGRPLVFTQIPPAELIFPHP